MKLTNGSRVVVVGGGPAGSFFAMHLLRLADEARLNIEVVIFEARDFSQPGPSGCNKCAGILSSTFLSKLNAFGLRLPEDIVQAKLDTYILHLDGSELAIRPQNPSEGIISVYRGGGPRKGSLPHPHSFDGWLLDQARENGAVVQRGRVKSIRTNPLPVVSTAKETIEADLVVIAAGVNSPTPLDTTWGYHPPLYEVMAQEEVLLPRNSLGGNVHVFVNRPSELTFGGLIPKGRYANISLLGKNLPRNSINQFLDSDEILPLLTENPPLLCGCFPKVGISSASGYFADRMVVVGDAAVARLYKDGIGAAFTTSKAAAATAISQGVSRQDFALSYQPVCQRIAADNRYGLWLFRLWDFTRRSPVLFNAWKQAILSEADLPSHQRVHARILWGTFTGDESYRTILSLVLSYPAFRAFFRGAVKRWRH